MPEHHTGTYVAPFFSQAACINDPLQRVDNS